MSTTQMNWKQLLSLKKFGDTQQRERKDENPTRVGFEVDYDRIIFSNAFLLIPSACRPLSML